MNIFRAFETNEATLASNVISVARALNPKPEIEWFITIRGVKMPALNMRNACKFKDELGGVVSWEKSE